MDVFEDIITLRFIQLDENGELIDEAEISRSTLLQDNEDRVFSDSSFLGRFPVDQPVRLRVEASTESTPVGYVGQTRLLQFAAGQTQSVNMKLFRVGQSTSLGTASDFALMLPTATTLNDGRVLITGGFDRVAPAPCPDQQAGVCSQLTATNRAFIYNPESGRHFPLPNMRHARGGHTATLLSDGRVLIIGGAGETFFAVASTADEFIAPAFFEPTGDALKSFEIFDPNAVAQNADSSTIAAGDFTTPPCAPEQMFGSCLNEHRFLHAAEVIEFNQRSLVLVAGGVAVPKHLRSV